MTASLKMSLGSPNYAENTSLQAELKSFTIMEGWLRIYFAEPFGNLWREVKLTIMALQFYS